jgi:F-type H+-transporting ATPase subunit a
MADALDTGHLIGHVKDAKHFEVPRFFAEDGKLTLDAIQLRGPDAAPLVELKTGIPLLDQLIEPFEGHITKFMVLELIAAVIVAVVFIRLAQRMTASDRPKGRLWNCFEAMLLFIRDEVARPAIGKHDADRFLPFLWTVFFFVLGCNLLGLVPWLGSPTGAFATTGALALITFITVIGTGMAKMGIVGFWTGQVPHMDLPLVLAILLKPMIFAIEVLGLVIKHFVLGVRLLANMLAGHLVLAVLVAFIAVAWNQSAIWVVAPASIAGATALSLLELFVAFLQAYIFTFLSALFIGMAVHPH